MADFDCFCQFTGHTVDFTIQWLILWPHSKWRNKCYYDNYVFLERVYKSMLSDSREVWTFEKLFSETSA